MTDEEIMKGFQVAAGDLKTNQEAIARLQANEKAQHAKLVEFAELWNENLTQIQAALSSQAEMLRALQAVVLRNEPIN